MVSSSTSRVAFLNEVRASPTDFPISGILLGPNANTIMIRRSPISQGPKLNANKVELIISRTLHILVPLKLAARDPDKNNTYLEKNPERKRHHTHGERIRGGCGHGGHQSG